MKYYGKIGYAQLKETTPGVWEEVVTEREYYGDVTRGMRRLEGMGINDNVVLSNDISVIADPFACGNYASIRYVTLLGTKWKVASVELAYPRLLLSTGGEYHEGTAA